MMGGALSLVALLLILAGFLPFGIAALWIGVVAWRRAVKTSEIGRELADVKQALAALHDDVKALREQQADLTLMMDDLPKLMLEDPSRAERRRTR